MTGQLTQVDLAEELGLSRETVNKILNGHTRNGGRARLLAASVEAEARVTGPDQGTVPRFMHNVASTALVNSNQGEL